MGVPRGMHLQVAPLISLALIGGIWLERQLFHIPVGDARAYHERVLDAADRLPYRIGEWVGETVDTPPAALSLLRPNVLLGRRFQNASTGEQATLMILQCKDARGMSGHYPPICYPAHGWTLRDAQARGVSVDNSIIPTAVYRFTIESADRFSEIVVYNFFVCPDGTIESGRAGVEDVAWDPRWKSFGAAQVQVVFGSAMSPDRRDEVFSMLISKALPVVRVIRDGA